MSVFSKIMAAICGEPRSPSSPPAAPGSNAMETARPRRRHRRLSNVRRLLRALGLISGLVAMATLLVGQGRDPAAARQDFLNRLVDAAIERTHHTVTYDPGYVAIAYPGGDVPANSGVCSDEIIRAYRALAVDLQKEVHEDIVRDFSAYPMEHWQQTHPDRNIDHRRVPNLMVFFARHGEELAITDRAQDYQPGDLVTWDLGNGHPHIGIVVNRKDAASGRFLIVHNIGAGPQMEDVLFDWKIIGHYRYLGPRPGSHEAILPVSR